MRDFLIKVNSFLQNKIGPIGFAYRPVRKKISKYQHLATGKLVDFGCGKKPFEKIFKNIDSYFGIDISKESRADMACDILHSDLESDIADSVLSTQALEHVQDPDKLISEISRIAKPGAICIVTAPFLIRVHGHPYDFFRFTKFGLEYLFKKNNFKIIAIEEIGGFFYTTTFMALFYIQERIGFFSYLINPFVMLPYYLFFRFIDRDKNHPANYIIVAKKTEE